CDPRFAGYPEGHYDRPPGFDASSWVDQHPVCNEMDRRLDDIYDDEQPMRASTNAAKLFVRELIDPLHDQIGYVTYSTGAQIESELQCLRRLGSGNCNAQVLEDTVVAALDATRAGGSTDIAGGMIKGLEVLSTDENHYGRASATHVMILMTDGRANQTPNTDCYSDDNRKWVSPDGTQGNNAQHCVIYYAHEARDQNVIVYTISLGGAADFELMDEVAALTGGVHRNADRPEMLPAIFQELYELMYLRLVE
ncbi:MAG TPA: VWA domain-containing protein, partial [Chloroflexi bacterium]|nr:VWA domain-containing protein [Chloroflexota bacterium]